MALRLGIGTIEVHGATKPAKLEGAMEKSMAQLGWEKKYVGKEPPSEEEAVEGAIQIHLVSNGDVNALHVYEPKVVRDLARLLSEQVGEPLRVMLTAGALFGRRSVEVTCRLFKFESGAEEELEVVGHHTADVKDVEHNELRQAENALRRRIDGANESLVAAEGAGDLQVKKIFNYLHVVKAPKFSSPRLRRVLDMLERAESFDVANEGEQCVVKIVLAGGAKSMSYVKPDELEELETAIEGRPEISRRRNGAAS